MHRLAGVRQAMLVQHQRPSAQACRQPRGNGHVAAGRQDHVRPEVRDRLAGLRHTQRNPRHVPHVGRRQHLQRIRRPADLARGDRRERDPLGGRDTGLQPVRPNGGQGGVGVPPRSRRPSLPTGSHRQRRRERCSPRTSHLARTAETGSSVPLSLMLRGKTPDPRRERAALRPTCQSNGLLGIVLIQRDQGSPDQRIPG